jgi:hypothetical protein
MSDTVLLALIVAAGAAFTAWLSYLQSRNTNGKLGQIHELVNSNMTSAIQDTYDATHAQLITLDQLLALQKSAGTDPSDDALVAREVLSKKVAVLTAKLSVRAKQTEIADSKV